MAGRNYRAYGSTNLHSTGIQIGGAFGSERGAALAAVEWLGVTDERHPRIGARVEKLGSSALGHKTVARWEKHDGAIVPIAMDDKEAQRVAIENVRRRKADLDRAQRLYEESLTEATGLGLTAVQIAAGMN